MTPAEFKAIFTPTFDAVSDSVVQTQLTLAVEWFDVCVWGGWYAEGLSNYVAHKLTMNAVAAAAPGGVAGGLDNTSLRKKVGDLDIMKSEQAMLKNMSNPFYRTIYGQEYLRLTRIVGSGMRAV
jgi:hypothetical protein